ncbi:uncharacterized protein LOC125457239 [Stegostoma tigrinum]|uniref:uncharacterized protein LOC125457239 n=1 Tax=Stegostoma tigrinum TaxID=3053191 RepID=UPI00202B8FD2|nr:uncharacterized protein LOC125457239 [Stegostoma tigrinum]
MSHYLKGGVVLKHQTVEGKHHYEVQDVLHCKSASSLLRRGDCLLQINEKNASDFPPEIVAELLRENSTRLTVCRPEHSEDTHIPEDLGDAVYWPYDKQKVKLQFSLKMVRSCGGRVEDATAESCDTLLPEGTGRWHGEGSKTCCEVPSCMLSGGEAVGDTCAGVKPCGLLVALNRASLSIVRGRGPLCSSGVVCPVCKEKECNIHTIAVSSEAKSELYYLEEQMPPGDCCGMIMKVMNSEYPFLIHNERNQYLRPGNCYQTIVLSQQVPESAQLTIFYYKSNKILKPYCGLPVVLNFSKTNYFLACKTEGSNILLRIEECTSQSLRKITENSPQWRFIFYMKERQDGTLSFESAQYRGWFINNKWNKQAAGMKRTVHEPLNADFIFILVKL